MLPEQLSPMLATPGALPPSGADASWAYEMKWDGVRALAYVDAGQVRLVSRNNLDMTTAYPEIVAAAMQFPERSLVLDGEIVSFGADGGPSFERLQKRMHVNDAAAAGRLALAEPVVFLAFDVLRVDGEDVLAAPYTERRARLEALGLSGPAWLTPPAFVGNGPEAVRVSRAQRLEGVVAKRLASPYTPGRRSPDWLKIKNLRAQEVVIGGWTTGEGHRADSFGALLLGLPHADGLSYIGKVGTGFTDAALQKLSTRLTTIGRSTSPFADVPRDETRRAHWVDPVLVGEVEFAGWTTAGRLRHPTWRGLRADKTPEDVVREG